MKTKIYSKNNTERIENFLRENQGFQFSVLQIQQALQSDAIKPNLTTIYRQLEKLIASGKVLQFYSEDGNTKLFQINQLNLQASSLPKLEKSEFIGRDALLRQKAEGVAKRLRGIELDDNAIPRHGYNILQNGAIIGQVTTGYRLISTNKFEFLHN